MQQAVQQVMHKALEQFNRLNLYIKSGIIIILAFLIVLAGYGIGRLLGMLFIQNP